MKDDIEVVSGAFVEKDKVYSFSMNLEEEITEFEVIYTPMGGLSADSIIKRITVTKRIFQHGAGLFVSPDGTSESQGTLEDPLDIETAIQYVLPGETIYLLEGTYTPSAMINITKEYSGTSDFPKHLRAYVDGKATIDGQGKLENVIQLNGDHWRLKGIRVTRAARSGMRLSGDHNVVELMEFSFNSDTGLIVSGSNLALWPKYNLILNCESHDNRDATDDNADGIAKHEAINCG
ncbi:hypothetical protein [Ectobacillus funiculus]|uniref:Pectate disaccharide-lyase-like central Ig-like domain-containing protein n=1 Tax=Ectobacillus funiculus TaxID=137993 RepID=A0ABV5WJD3_9BACI